MRCPASLRLTIASSRTASSSAMTKVYGRRAVARERDGRWVILTPMGKDQKPATRVAMDRAGLPSSAWRTSSGGTGTTPPLPVGAFLHETAAPKEPRD